MGNADNYDGVVDETGADSVTVTVGVEGNGGLLAFNPAAVEVSAGTTVVWERTGECSYHDGGDFESELADEEGHEFEHTFDEARNYKHACSPHESVGVKGVVVSNQLLENALLSAVTFTNPE